MTEEERADEVQQTEAEPEPPPMPPRQGETAIWREFFSLTGGSIVYCLSALSIIYGIAKMLGPSLAQAGILQEAYPCLAAMNIYEVALLGVLVFIVVWEKVTDDAISLVVLVALFLIGSGLTLTTVASSGTRMSVAIGACCFAVGVGKLHVLRKHIGILFSGVSFLGLCAILAWNFGAGPLLTRTTTHGAVSRAEWLLASLALIAGGVIVLLDALRSYGNADQSAVAPAPFLRRRPMALLFVIILLVAGIVHQYVLGYVCEVQSALGDYLPLVSVVSLIALLASLSTGTKAGSFEIGLASLPLITSVFAMVSRAVLPVPSAGWGWLWSTPVVLGLTGAAVCWLAIRAQSAGLFGVVAAYAFGVILTCKGSIVCPRDLNWHAAGALLVAGTLCVGLLRRSLALCLFAVILATVGFATTDTFEHIVRAWKLNGTPTALGMAGFGILLIALFFGRETPRFIAMLGALGVMVLSFDLMARAPVVVGVSAGVGVLSLCVLLWFRLRHWPTVVILLVPLGYRLWLVFSRLTAWRYVILSFVLLFAGAWLSTLKGRRSRKDDRRPVDTP